MARVDSDRWTGLAPERKGRIPTRRARRLSRVLTIISVAAGVAGGSYSLLVLGNGSGALVGYGMALSNVLLGLNAWSRRPEKGGA